MNPYDAPLSEQLTPTEPDYEELDDPGSQFARASIWVACVLLFILTLLLIL